MIRICSDCKKYMGEKPPYEDTSVTHGMCPACVDKVRETLREMRDIRSKVKGESSKEKGTILSAWPFQLSPSILGG